MLLGIELEPKRIVVIPLTAVGIALSLLQQCTLGTLYVMSANALDSLWWTWRLPMFVYFDSISLGFALGVCLQILSSHLAGRQQEQSELDMLTGIAKGAVGLACFHFIVCLGALALTSDVYAILRNLEFYVPIGLGVVLPGGLVVKSKHKFLLIASLLLLFSLLFSRLDVMFLGLE